MTVLLMCASRFRRTLQASHANGASWAYEVSWAIDASGLSMASKTSGARWAGEISWSSRLSMDGQDQ
jgi:hypothetical protein